MERFKQVKTGNLPAALVATARPYNSKPETEEWSVSKEGMRLVHVGYKGKDAPQNFTVEVPATFEIPDEWENFTTALALLYQNRLVHEVVDGESKVDPTDWTAVIKDFFDTSRNKNSPSLEEVEGWFSKVWIPAYEMRVSDRNSATAKDTPPGRPQTEEETKRITGKYKDYTKQISKKTCGLSETIIRGVKQSIAKLLELGYLMEDDEIALFLVERAENHLEESQKQNSEYTEATV